VSRRQLLHADAIEERAGVDGGGIGESGRAGLANDVALDDGEGRLRGEIAAALLTGQYPTVELSYVSNGQFVPISQVGNILN
jgi:hypothetical protein